MKKIRELLSGAALVALPLASLTSGCATTETKTDTPAVVEKAPEEEKPKPRPDSAAALVADGTKLLKEGRATDAKGKFEAALAKEPDNVDAKVGLAQADLKLGDFDGANAILTALQKANPDSREVVLLLGLLHTEQGNFDKGIVLYEKELERQKAKGQAPDRELLNNLITMYRLAKQYDDAVKACTTLLSRDPKNADALKNLSLVYFDQGKFDLAETIAENSLKLNDKDASLYNNRGMIRVKKKRYPEAMSFFYKAVQIDPNNLSAHLNIASIALRYRDYANAAKHYSDAMKLEPRHPEANLGYGLALAGVSGGLPPDDQAKKAPDAIAQLQRALEIDPDASEALGEIAMIQKLQLNNLAEAKGWCDKYKEKRGRKFDDKDVMKGECSNIDNEIRNRDAAAKAMAAAKAAQAEEDEARKAEEEKKKAEEAAKQPAPPPAEAPPASPPPAEAPPAAAPPAAAPPAGG
jgi:tetratricopeptide (TPR) repeat protein